MNQFGERRMEPYRVLSITVPEVSYIVSGRNRARRCLNRSTEMEPLVTEDGVVITSLQGKYGVAYVMLELG